MLHVNVDALMNAVVPQRADQLQSRPVAHMREARILVPAEAALKDAAIRRAIKHRAPRLQFTHAVGSLFRVDLRHARLIHAHSMWRRLKQPTQRQAFSHGGARDGSSREPPTRWRSE